MIWWKLLYEHCNVLKRSIPIPIPRIAPQFYIRLWRVILQRLTKILALWYIWRVQWTLIVHRLGGFGFNEQLLDWPLCTPLQSGFIVLLIVIIIVVGEWKRIGHLVQKSIHFWTSDTSDMSIDWALRHLGFNEQLLDCPGTQAHRHTRYHHHEDHFRAMVWEVVLLLAPLATVCRTDRRGQGRR